MRADFASFSVAGTASYRAERLPLFPGSGFGVVSRWHARRPAEADGHRLPWRRRAWNRLAVQVPSGRPEEEALGHFTGSVHFLPAAYPPAGLLERLRGFPERA